MVVAVALAVLACTLWLVKLYWENRRFIRLASAIPSAKTGPFGVVGDFLLGKSVEELTKKVLGILADEDGMLKKAWFGCWLVVGISRAEHFQVIMNSKNNVDRGPLLTKFLKAGLGRGLLTAPVDIWRKTRKLLNPAFNKKLLYTFLPIFAEKCDILIEILEKNVGVHDVNLRKIFTRFSLDAIFETSLGAHFEGQTSDHNLDDLVHKYMDLFMLRIANLWYFSDTIFGLSKQGRQVSKLVAECEDIAQEAMNRGRLAIDVKRQGKNDEETDDPQHKTFMDILLEESSKNIDFSDEQFRDEVNTIITTASDTTGQSLSYCLLAMALHPEFQENLYKEAIEVLGEERYATKDDLAELNYTEMFIKETLRIFPVVPVMMRKITEDLTMDDLVIPKGAWILLDILHLHRNPKYWKDPLKFDPDRFLPENAAELYPYAYLPFSGGVRNCIGSRYAMMMMKTILSKIVRKFKVKTDYKSVEEVELTIKIISCPTNGFKVSLEARK